MDTSENCAIKAARDRALAANAETDRMRDLHIASAERWEEMGAIMARVEHEKVFRDEATRQRAEAQGRVYSPSHNSRAARAARG